MIDYFCYHARQATTARNPLMRADIHPDYRPVLFHDTTADAFFLIGSTVKTGKTHAHTDGVTYPYVSLDISSASHPFYTGETRQMKTEGRVASFNKRFGRFGKKATDGAEGTAE
jgi:large subunit ribosomal protein L31